MVRTSGLANAHSAAMWITRAKSTSGLKRSLTRPSAWGFGDGVEVAPDGLHGVRVGWILTPFEALPGDEAGEFGVVGVSLAEPGGILRDVVDVDGNAVDELQLLAGPAAHSVPI